MTEQTITTGATLLKRTVTAILLAIALLVLVVLPVEYGIDPTGIGKAMGLTELAPPATEMEHHSAESIEDYDPIAEALNGTEINEDDTPFRQGIANAHKASPLSTTFSIILKPLDEVEYKAVLTAGEPMLYSWSVVGGEEVYFDFHGDPTEGEFPDEYFQRYEEGEVVSAKGSFTATFTGNHGWYWLNISDNDITIKLEATGYYSSLKEIFRGNQRDKYK